MRFNNCKIKKDYQAKNLHNPFFHKKPTGKSRAYIKWLILLFISLVFFVVWLLFGARYWNISVITLNGINRVPKESVEEIVWRETDKTRWLFFSSLNIFLFDTESVCEKLLADFNLTDCEIKRDLPSTIAITGYERPYAFIWQEGSDLYYSSRDGYIIKDQVVSEEDMNKYFILENKNVGSLIGHNNIINVKSDYLNFAFELNKNIASQENIILEKFIIDFEFNTLKAKFVNGPIVFFNTRDNSLDQLNRLILVKNEKIKDNFSNTDYIDLRYGDKIFINPEFN